MWIMISTKPSFGSERSAYIWRESTRQHSEIHVMAKKMHEIIRMKLVHIFNFYQKTELRITNFGLRNN